MKTIKFQDKSNSEITVQLSGGGDYRIYLENKHFPNINRLHLTKNQANILINALQDLFIEDDE